VKWILVARALGVERPSREVDHSLPPRMRGVYSDTSQ
jgi:hypothetical protein